MVKENRLHGPKLPPKRSLKMWCRELYTIKCVKSSTNT